LRQQAEKGLIFAFALAQFRRDEPGFKGRSHGFAYGQRLSGTGGGE
jgi:hypothetical protein